MHSIQSLLDVLIEEIKELYSAETQLARALPQFIKAAEDSSLKLALSEHLAQTRQPGVRLQEVADVLGISPAGKTCQAMQGLIAEGMERLGAGPVSEVRDASLACIMQKIKQYEIVSYGCARSFAQILHLHLAATILQTTLDEECAQDRNLSSLAELVNSRAESPYGMLSVVS